MNYLAHLFLAGKNHGMILGALLEDYVTGGVENEINKILPQDVKTGLKLHRHIDTLTDTDAAVKDIKQLFYSDYGKYSSVIVDVIFDHFLHKNWHKFTDEPFDSFKDYVYKSLSEEFQDIQPSRLKALVSSMREHDWLKNYIHFWGLEKSLASLNRRISNMDLTTSLSLVKDNYEFINERFLDFFSRLKESCESEFINYGK